MEDPGYLIAAIVGASIYALRFGEGSWQQRALILFAGVGFAQWLGPLLGDLLHVETRKQIYGLGFGCGIVGDRCLVLLVHSADRLVQHYVSALLKKQ